MHNTYHVLFDLCSGLWSSKPPRGTPPNPMEATSDAISSPLGHSLLVSLYPELTPHRQRRLKRVLTCWYLHLRSYYFCYCTVKDIPQQAFLFFYLCSIFLSVPRLQYLEISLPSSSSVLSESGVYSRPTNSSCQRRFNCHRLPTFFTQTVRGTASGSHCIYQESAWNDA